MVEILVLLWVLSGLCLFPRAYPLLRLRPLHCTLGLPLLPPSSAPPHSRLGMQSLHMA